MAGDAQCVSLACSVSPDSEACLALSCTRRLASRASLSSAVSAVRRSLARSLSCSRR